MQELSFKTFEKTFDKYAPRRSANFEYSGIIQNSKPSQRPIKRIGLTLDLTLASVRDAIKKNCDLLIAFHAPDQLEKSVTWQQRVQEVSNKKITLYKAHLRLNFCKGGVHEILAQLCNFHATPLTFTLENRFTISGGVYRVHGAYALKKILKNLSHLSAPEIRIFNGDRKKMYKKILLSSGSGFKNEFFDQFKPDMIISGEVKHSAIRLAEMYKTTLVEATHWATEEKPLKNIAPLLGRFLNIPVTFIPSGVGWKIFTKTNG